MSDVVLKHLQRLDVAPRPDIFLSPLSSAFAGITILYTHGQSIHLASTV